MKRDLKLIFGSVIAAVIIFGLLVTPPMQQVIQDSLPDDTLGRYVKTIVVGMLGEAGAAEADYQCNGTADNYWWQLALDALPPTGGKIIGLGGNYNFTATVSRAINNVTIEGLGRSSYFYNDASTPIFSAGSQTSWVFKEFATDEGWVTLADNTVVVNCWNEGILTNEVQGDVDYNGYMAIAMSCDQGATMPVAPQTGQWFLHTPTGRKILYQYDGSDWQSIVSLGDVTVYVDKSDGTDDLNHGFGVDGNAFASIQYAVDSIPKGCPGTPSIYINNESYTEDVYVRGTGGWQIPSGIAIYGTLDQVTTGVATGGTQGATTTTPKVQGNFLANQYDNKLIKFTSGSNNDTYHVIGLTTTTNLCLVGEALTAQPQNGDTYTIYDWGTEIDGLINVGPNTRIRVYDLAVTRAAPSGYGTCIWGWAYADFLRCKFSTTGSPYSITFAQAGGGLTTCLVSVTGALKGLQLEENAGCEVDYSRFIGDDTAGSVGINVVRTSNLASFRYGCEIEGFDKGISLEDCGGYGWSPNVYSNIHGCTYGVYAESGGQLLYTEFIQFGKELDGNNDANTADEFKEYSSAQIYKAADAAYQYIPTAAWTHVLLDTVNYDLQSECDVTVVAGTAENIAGANLQDTGMFTESAAYYTGRTLWNITDNTYTTVTGKTSDNVLTLAGDIMDIGELYRLYFSRFTASEAGYYLVVASIAYDTTNTIDAKMYIASVWKNGVETAKNRIFASANAQYCQCQTTAIVSLAAGDYVDLRTYHNTGVTAKFSEGLSAISLAVTKLV